MGFFLKIKNTRSLQLILLNIFLFSLLYEMYNTNLIRAITIWLWDRQAVKINIIICCWTQHILARNYARFWINTLLLLLQWNRTWMLLKLSWNFLFFILFCSRCYWPLGFCEKFLFPLFVYFFSRVASLATRSTFWIYDLKFAYNLTTTRPVHLI